MANKAISELPQAQNVNNQDLFVLEQSGIAKKLPAETFITEQGIIDALAEALDGHGGIQSVTLSSVSGRIRTYRITFTDQSATTFQVYDGTSIDRISRTSSSGLDDVYTIFLSDGTTTFFTVHNGADGNVSEAMLNDALKDKAPAITETTESGAIATFTDGADDMPLHNILAEINPVQDLNGYDNPWPAGSGKNLFGGSYNELFELHIPSGTTVCAYCDNTATINYYGADGQTRIDYWTVSSAGRVFTLTADAYYFRFNGASEGATPTKMYIAIENAFSGYLPYSNICPITGHTEVNVTRTGKNFVALNVSPVQAQFLREVTVSEQTAQKLTLVSSSAPYAGLRLYYHLKAGTYTASVSATSSDSYEPTISIYRYGSNDLIVQNIKDGTPQSFTISEDLDVDIRLFATLGTAAVRTVTFSNFQIELGSTASAYEPYITPTTVSLSWQTEAGTVYGGTIDVATGLLTVTEVLYQTKWKDGASATVLGNNTRKIFTSGFVANYPNYTRTPISNIAPYKANYNEDSLHFYVNSTSSNNTLIYLPNDTDGETVIQICYGLATPQTYQLTPQEVKTLLGTNNVWADTGNTSVTYAADTKMFIEKLTMPTEDDLVANQAITSGKYFMVGNSLYLALANIASGAQITIGTNAQRVSLADALNTINS